jgi:hypothetical protein
MGGLRSAASLQFQLLRQTKLDSSHLQSLEASIHGIDSHRPMSPWSLPEERSFLESIDERPEEEVSEPDVLRPTLSRRQTSDSEADIALLPADIFAIFIDHLGPSMVSISAK